MGSCPEVGNDMVHEDTNSRDGTSHGSEESYQSQGAETTAVILQIHQGRIWSLRAVCSSTLPSNCPANPPPCIYSTRENNTYQELEEPILKNRFGGPPVRRIDYLHPAVDGAAHITYQVRPCDKSQDWAASFGGTFVKKWKKLN